MVGKAIGLVVKESFRSDRVKKLVAIGALGVTATALGMIAGYEVKVANAMLTRMAKEVAKDVAMQAAAMKPEYVTEDEIPEDRIERERNIFKEQAINEGKPAEIAEKMVEGRIKKFFKEICLVHQAFIKDGDIDVATYVKNNGGKVEKMIRFEVGEGMEKRNDNFAEEVMNQIK